MRITKNHFVYTTLVAAAALGTEAYAATESLAFGIFQPTSGSIRYSGDDTDPLIGRNISVDNVIGLNTPSNAGVFGRCDRCTLNFSSGAFENITTESNGFSTWNFSGGGAISVVGGIDFDLNPSNSLDIARGTTLLSGTFDSVSVTQLDADRFGIRLAEGAFSDTKNATLLAFYGLPIGIDYLGDLAISFDATRRGQGFGSSSVFNGTIVNSPVPVPAALWLMLSALAGLFGFTKRAQRSSSRDQAIAIQ